jgi:hypothetical protein
MPHFLQASKSWQTRNERGSLMATTATPKIVGKALYLELVADPTQDPKAVRSLLGWKSEGTKQVIIFPQYQDDTGKVYEPMILSRVVSTYSPKAQWEFSRVSQRSKLEPKKADASSHYGGYYTEFESYKNSEFDSLTQREQYEVRKHDLLLHLKSILIDTDYEDTPDESGERKVFAKQGWVVRDSQPIVVEITDQDWADLNDRKTPQAVIRRINKVRESISSFPNKLA